MDRKGQLRNVAFGGAWSEQIAGNEELAEALAVIDAAIDRTRDEDLRQARDVREAIERISSAHPKGGMLAIAWDRALNLTHASSRSSEIQRLAIAYRLGLGDRIGRGG
ncbi:hypothetical protein Q0601_00770 [Paracoccus onubensis]|uniref:hypothetical protein n=1 Tax=Paracoccus onubensis TaxID=1675788 RepID=UPI00272FA074|nr:hypothetical protein [Paracoccus onubensis]MDP0925694.1 hypothetical protein [Paracoccus onubensis]